MSFIEDWRQALSTWIDKQNAKGADETEKYKYENVNHEGTRSQKVYENERDKLYEMEHRPFLSFFKGYDTSQEGLDAQRQKIDELKRRNDIYTFDRLASEFGYVPQEDVEQAQAPDYSHQTVEDIERINSDRNSIGSWGNPFPGTPSGEEYWQAAQRLDESEAGRKNYDVYRNGGDYVEYSDQDKKDLQTMYDYLKARDDKENMKMYEDLLQVAHGSQYDSAAEDPNVAFDENGDIHPKEEEKAPVYDLDEMAGEFILGAWGNGQDRVDNLLASGFTLDDYNKIQERVNEAYESGRDLHELTDKANQKLNYW